MLVFPGVHDPDCLVVLRFDHEELLLPTKVAWTGLQIRSNPSPRRPELVLAFVRQNPTNQKSVQCVVKAQGVPRAFRGPEVPVSIRNEKTKSLGPSDFTPVPKHCGPDPLPQRNQYSRCDWLLPLRSWSAIRYIIHPNDSRPRGEIAAVYQDPKHYIHDNPSQMKKILGHVSPPPATTDPSAISQNGRESTTN